MLENQGRLTKGLASRVVTRGLAVCRYRSSQRNRGRTGLIVQNCRSDRDMSDSEAPNGPDAPWPLAGGVVAIPPSSMPGGVFSAELEAGECPDMVEVDVLGRTPRWPIHSPLSTPAPDAEYANSAGAGPPWKEPYGSAMLRLRWGPK